LGPDHFRFGDAQFGLGAPGLDVGAQRVLLGNVAGPQAPLGRLGQLARAAGQACHLLQARLRSQQVVEGARGRLLLLHQGLGQVQPGGLQSLLRGLSPQPTLVATLNRPVQAHALVDALFAPQIAWAQAVVEIDGAGLGRQRGQRRSVGGLQVALGCRHRVAGPGHVGVLAGGAQRLLEGHRRGGGSGSSIEGRGRGGRCGRNALRQRRASRQKGGRRNREGEKAHGPPVIELPR
jgi:hypothetical protein